MNEQGLRTKVARHLAEANPDIARLDERIQGFARQRPVTAALIALTAGFFIGRLVSRR